jgi:hypothetical protein
MYSLILTITLLANQPQGAPAQFLETVSVFGTNSKADCERLTPYAVSYWTRMYAEKGQYVSTVPTCVGSYGSRP